VIANDQRGDNSGRKWLKRPFNRPAKKIMAVTRVTAVTSRATKLHHEMNLNARACARARARRCLRHSIDDEPVNYGDIARSSRKQ